MFVNTYTLIEFGRLGLPTEIKFYKKLLARIHKGHSAKIHLDKFTKFKGPSDVYFLFYFEIFYLKNV